MKGSGEAIRAIAIYLPQFHPIPENDRWWGQGFTEWTNVRRGQPRFAGHYQPHVPGPLGYYDLRDASARAAQAALARQYGITGFCYYHYWFNGKRLLETPLTEVLRSGQPDFPFCVCWANENWTRRWDGHDQEVLMAQTYSDEDSAALIRELLPTFRDERYIRVNGKPLFLVYRTGLLPDPKRAAEIWREEARRAGVGDLYLVRVETGLHGPEPRPEDLGFDAAMEFAPNWRGIGNHLHDVGGQPVPSDVRVHDYRTTARNHLSRPMPEYTLFRGVFPSWDNSVRRKHGATVFAHTSPQLYAYWLSTVAAQTLQHRAGDERIVFINAWNEWAEGCHLEPDQKNGFAYLEATARALRQVADLEPLLTRREDWLNGNDRPLRNWYEALSDLQLDPKAAEQIARLLQANANLVSHWGPPCPLDEMVRLHQQQLSERDALIAAMERSLWWRMFGPLRRWRERRERRRQRRSAQA
jgi:lipopolysaccharide biosynthesis protein